VPVIPATWEMEIRKMKVQGQPGQKVRHPSQQTGWAWCCACGPTWEDHVGGSRSEPNLSKS
jgi:hypothetical protein